MIEIKIEKLPKEFIDYVKQNTGVVKSYVNDKPLYYSRGGCHVNSVLLCDDISSSNKYPVAIIEGLMVCSDGMAYDHCWNVVRDDDSELHYLDVTMDAIASDYERAMEKKYFAVKELSKEEMMKRIANEQPLFSKETHLAIDEYYAAHPEKEAEYRRGKREIGQR